MHANGQFTVHTGPWINSATALFARGVCSSGNDKNISCDDLFGGRALSPKPAVYFKINVKRVVL